MTILKKHIVYALLTCYVGTVATGLFMIVSGAEVPGTTVLGIFSAVVVQTAAIIVAFIKSPEYFAEPEAIANLEKKQIEEIKGLQSELAKSLQDRENLISYIGTKIMPDDPNHPLYRWIQEQKRKELQTSE